MQLYNGNHPGALESIELAVRKEGHQIAQTFDRYSKSAPLSLPAAIWAITSLSKDAIQLEDALIALDYTLAIEPNKKYVPIVISAFMDRLVLRDDVLQPAHVRSIFESAREHILDERARAAAMLIITYKCFMLLKLNQDYLAATEINGTKRNPGRTRRALEMYDATLQLLRELLTDIRSNDRFFMDSLENRDHTGMLSKQLYEYAAFRPKLQELADRPQ